jgi:hypothetical protein
MLLEKWKKVNGYSNIDKCWYEIEEQKEVSVWYTGPFRALPRSKFFYMVSYDKFH